MGNKRNRLPLNKRANNWKVIRNIKKRKTENENNSEFGDQVTLEDIELSVGCSQTTSYQGNSESDPESYPEIKTEAVDPLSLGESEDNGGVQHHDVKEENNNEIGTDEAECKNLPSSSDEDDERVQLSGRRFFDISHLFEKLKEIGRHSRNCSYEDMFCISETKKGFNSIFKFKCRICNSIRKLESCPVEPLKLTVNEEAVLGVNLIGSGFYHIEEFASQLNVPCMGASTYDEISKEQQKDWITLAEESALAALCEEVELAKANGEIDENGNARIAVISDGGWGKRSYGKTFNSLSGCAVLIGLRTKKVIYYGSRNKYCHVCKIAQSNCTPVREHDCNINYTGPSSGMEPDIILEGFRSSEASGARYFKLIADGDSTVYKTLRDQRVYKNPDLVIVKVECVNHLCRNFRSKFRALNKITKFNSKLRKQITKRKANDICKGVKSAAMHWKQANISAKEKITNLQDDIMNAPSHYFGVHTKCKPYFCNKTTSRKAKNNENALKRDGLYYEVLNLCQVYFSANATSLLENETNNPAEQFNNIVAKYLGGKRINYSLAKSYSARVAMAVVQHNSGGHAATAFRKYKLGDTHNPSTEKLENRRRQKLKANEVALQRKPRSRHTAEPSRTAEYFHGDNGQGLDKPLEELQKGTDILLKKLRDRQKNRINIELRTREDENYWHEMRQDMLPSSHFHKIVNAKKRETYTSILQELMYNRSEFGNNAQNKHEDLYVRFALDSFKSEVKETLQECGLVIDRKLSFLCTSPFKLCGSNHILKIKCPLKEFGKHFADVASKMQFFKKVSGNLAYNEKSPWFIELQGEMHITGREYAYLMIWLGHEEYRIIEVQKNYNFFKETIEPKLTFFYMEAMLKELVDPRVEKHMKLRVYDDQKSTFV